MADEFLQLLAIAPHPPIIIPEVGREERWAAKKTIDGMTRLAAEVTSRQPETVVVITPHATLFRDAVTVSMLEQLTGDLGRFGAHDLTFRYESDTDLAGAIVWGAAALKVTAAGLDQSAYRSYGISTSLDHGALVPLYFLREQGARHKLVWIAIGLLSSDELYAFGVAIQRAVAETQRRTVILVSGDLSHRLTKDAPAGYDPRGAEFDRLVERSLSSGDFMRLLEIDEGLSESAGECGLRPLQMGLGALDGYRVQSELLSYEGPYGVGYLTALLVPGSHDQPSLLAGMRRRAEDRIVAIRERESAEVRLARETLELYVRTGETAKPGRLPSDWQRRAGVFVSIKKRGQLRGCIGTIEPTRANLAEEIIHNAINAGGEDPRFGPVQEDELAHLVYSVDILAEPELIDGSESLDPERYGVIVRSGRKSGLLLPHLEGISTVDEQLQIAKQKAGIRPGEPVKLWRFEVVRYH